MKYKHIEVRAARTQQRVLDGQCDLVNTMETISQAKDRARYYLTDDYQRSSESSEPMRYSQVVADGVCLFDYFRKETACNWCGHPKSSHTGGRGMCGTYSDGHFCRCGKYAKHRTKLCECGREIPFPNLMYKECPKCSTVNH